MLVIIIKVAASIVLGILAGFAAVYIFNKMPAGWLCDYGEKPGPELTDPHIQRVKGYPWRWIYAAGFACLLVRLSFCRHTVCRGRGIRVLGDADHRPGRSEIHGDTRSVRDNAGSERIRLHTFSQFSLAASAGGDCRRRRDAGGRSA